MPDLFPDSINDSITRFRTQFLEHKTAQANNEPGWLALVRKNALERFLDKGFPTTRDEEWRFTNVGPLASASFTLSALPRTDAEDDARALKKRFELGKLESHELVFVTKKSWSSLEKKKPVAVPTAVGPDHISMGATT